MKKDIEKYISDNIKAQTPPSLSKENIIQMLDNEIEEAKPQKRLRKQTVYKFVAVAAAFALLLSGVTVYGSIQKSKKIPLINDGFVQSTANSYDEIYAKLKEMKSEQTYAVNAIEDFASADIGWNTSETAGSKNEMAAPGASASDENTSNSSFGTTNTQEANVDEGDIIKTDGKNIYLVDRDNDTVYIVNAENGKMSKSSEIKLDGNVFIQEIYLTENKLTVIFTEYNYPENEKPEVYNGFFGEIYACGYPLSWACAKTNVNIYDVSNPQNVSLLSSFAQSGDYVSSRLNKGKLYIVSNYCVDISARDYKKKAIPEITENGACERVPADKITLIKDTDTPTFAVISTIDVASSKRTDSSAVFGYPSNVYATENSLFIVERKYDNQKYDSYLNICKFEFTENGVQYKASAKAQGRLNDNLSMSEYKGFFRIATTCRETKVIGDGQDASISFLGETNKLYVFDEDMNRVGLIDGFAKNEQIRSARYIGDYAYVVTFRQTDPLFVINLSDPTNPKIEGELKLPGFSSYLHPIGNGMLIGVGYDGDEFNANGNMKVSLFSVADPKNPKELSKVLVGNNMDYVTSNLSYAYKAFVSLGDGEFAVPFSINSGRNQMFIRYKVADGTVYEIARYGLGNLATDIIGGTYIGNYFYAFSSEFVDAYKSEDITWKARLTSFNMETNEQAEIITLS